MRKSFCLILLLFVLPAAYAQYDKLVYNGWVEVGKPVVVNNETYSFEYRKDRNLTLVFMPERTIATISPEVDKCSETWIFKVCQSNQKFTRNGAIVDPDAHNNDIKISLQVTIHKTEFIFNLSREFDKTNLYLGDTAKVSVVLDRTGPVYLENVTFTDPYPGFAVTDVLGCSLEGDTVVWRGSINNSKKTCSYSIRPVRAMSFTSNASVRFTGLNTTKIVSKTKLINVTENPLVVTYLYPNETKPMGLYYLNITLRPKQKVFLHELRVVFPDNFEILNSSGLSRQLNSFGLLNTWLSANEVATFSIYARTKKAGNYTIPIDISYDYGNTYKSQKDYATAKVVADAFEVTVFKKESGNAIRVSNPLNATYKNIEIVAGNHTYAIPVLEPRKYKEFTLPEASESMIISIRYTNEYNQVFTTYVTAAGENSSSVVATETTINGQKSGGSAPVEVKNKPGLKLDIKVDQKILLPAGIAAGVILSLAIIIMLIIKKRGSGLDREIDRLRKEEELAPGDERKEV